jgi:hypothetical protein
MTFSPSLKFHPKLIQRNVIGFYAASQGGKQAFFIQPFMGSYYYSQLLKNSMGQKLPDLIVAQRRRLLVYYGFLLSQE